LCSKEREKRERERERERGSIPFHVVENKITVKYPNDDEKMKILTLIKL
jgi:hypothetical protein